MYGKSIAFIAAAALALGCGDSKSGSKKSPGGSSDKSDLSGLGGEAPLKRGIKKQGTRTGTGNRGRYHELPFDSVKIVFENSGMTVGTTTVWMADRGATVVTEQNLTKPGKTHNRIVWKDGKTTMWDLDDKNKKVHVTRLRNKATERRVVSTQKEAMLTRMGYVKKGTETVAGQVCDAWHNEKQRVSFCRWNGIDIKISNNALKKVKLDTVAKSIEIGAKMPPGLTEPPADQKK
jgi:hypothetical protein